MTPQERQLIDDLFDRLTRLESAPRDPDAERAIRDGLERAPHAIYALVQTVLVQDEALKRADARIRELSGEDEAPRQAGGSFLDTMRSALGGRSGGSVPNVRPQQAQSGGPDPRWNACSCDPSRAQGCSSMRTFAEVTEGPAATKCSARREANDSIDPRSSFASA